MKQFFLIATMLLTFGAVNAQSIGNVDFRSDGYAKVYDDKNNQIASGYVGSSSDEFDFSSCIIVSRRSDGYVKIYDQKLNQIASGYAGDKNDSFKVVGCNIVFKRSDGYKKTYDKKLNQISSGY